MLHILLSLPDPLSMKKFTRTSKSDKEALRLPQVMMTSPNKPHDIQETVNLYQFDEDNHKYLFSYQPILYQFVAQIIPATV